eukprot:CAMPEP_0178402276 /NCGR_PEP_ID=MMETSP0689_2-20121128/16751_1 /TAXON_ID=160604 /ORGANISM="Amphidinium massartii, Strain CS-259" /LENGTH=84 /DNA_ID=CAMNT_0020023157 /DNA_START=387 /DNA_END=641 /DNA_ORIENTATION=-
MKNFALPKEYFGGMHPPWKTSSDPGGGLGTDKLVYTDVEKARPAVVCCKVLFAARCMPKGRNKLANMIKCLSSRVQHKRHKGRG